MYLRRNRCIHRVLSAHCGGGQGKKAVYETFCDVIDRNLDKKNWVWATTEMRLGIKGWIKNCGLSVPTEEEKRQGGGGVRSGKGIIRLEDKVGKKRRSRV